MKNNPCKNCTDREVGCHSTCGRYKKYRKELDDRKQIIFESKRKELHYRSKATEDRIRKFKKHNAQNKEIKYMRDK